jgi:sucrose-6-phosphate hydrolase SacC (GH32 family)
MKQLILLIALLTRFAALAGDGGFLFATFKGEQTPMTEQIYFALSSDGRQWNALSNAQPVLVSTLGEKGVRDPYLLRTPDGNKFYLIATDLSINLNRDWRRAVRAGSKSIVIWDSTDLVHWSAPRLVKVAPDDAGCTWAPEAIYDDSRKEYLVFWASTTARDDFAKHRIWAAWTKDFITFGKPFIYTEKPWTLIDSTIVRENGKYYRFSKDEKEKDITFESSDNLTGTWTDATNFSLAKMRGYEGPECYIIKPAADGKPATWCLILDQYSKGTGYQPFVTEDLSSGQFKAGEGFVFPFKFRHGSVLPVSAAEYERLEKAYVSTPRQ